MIKALVFDFDGLILETETPIFNAWCEVYRKYNCELTLEQWLSNVGTAVPHFDPVSELQRQLGDHRDLSEEVEWQRRREAELIMEEDTLPGVREILAEGRELGLKIGLASSSTCQWVVDHLTRLGLLDYFEAVAAKDDVTHTKPDPALFRQAVDWLGVSPQEALAFEDSLNGVRSAKAAGLYCVAVPNQITRSLKLDEADLQLASLAGVRLDDLLERFN